MRLQVGRTDGYREGTLSLEGLVAGHVGDLDEATVLEVPCGQSQLVGIDAPVSLTACSLEAVSLEREVEGAGCSVTGSRQPAVARGAAPWP